jgi:hypothetical protein
LYVKIILSTTPLNRRFRNAVSVWGPAVQDERVKSGAALALGCPRQSYPWQNRVIKLY